MVSKETIMRELTEQQRRDLEKNGSIHLTGPDGEYVLRRAGDTTHCLIDPATPEGASSGLHGASVVVCVNLYTLEQTDILRRIGHLSAALLQRINACLKCALELP